MVFPYWQQRVMPFRVIGNLYFVGSLEGSAHLFDTGDELIIIDTGYPQTIYKLIENVRALGFDPYKIRHIVHSHGHYDHCGGTRALAELTGAKTYIGAEDRDYANGTLDLSWARELGFYQYIEPFEPDVLLSDGDSLTVGDTTIDFIATPGHTPGCMSMFFDVVEDGVTYRAGTFGGSGLNSLERAWMEENNVPLSLREDFLRSIDRVIDLPVDVFIGNHFWNNNSGEKIKHLGETLNPFIVPGEWRAFLEDVRRGAVELFEREK
jgi:metallo-beta-lactamase class B